MGPIVCEEEGPSPALYKLLSVSRGLCGSENSIELHGCFIGLVRSGVLWTNLPYGTEILHIRV